MKISTDYRAEINLDTFRSGAMSEYRLLMYFCDVLKNFFADSINIKDERLLTLLGSPKDSKYIGKNITVAPPFHPDMREGCTTPAIRVGLGELTFPIQILDNALPATSPAGWISTGKKLHFESVALQIAVITENYTGTILLSSLIKDFLMVNTLNMIRDSKMLNNLKVTGTSAPEHIAITSAGNAKDLFQRTIGLSATGTYAHLLDVQGPVFKGVQVSVTAS